jgi:sirohydrochlorin cobaltochelatase
MQTNSRPLLSLTLLEARLKTLLPAEYQERYEDVQPVSMGSAGLKFDSNGLVAWDQIWGSFCDLAMAGGPPHRGTLLAPGSLDAIALQPAPYREIAAEICRGVTLVTKLATSGGEAASGWVRVQCPQPGMAEWLLRAVVMENVSARCDGNDLELPVGPTYRIGKEVKNVVTSIAKTFHYFSDHMWAGQQRDIAELLATLDAEAPLLQPGSDSPRGLHASGAASIRQTTGLQCPDPTDPGWIGVECTTVRAAVWMMRMMVASNVLARREGTVLFVPLLGETGGEAVLQSLHQVHRFAVIRGVCG